MIKKFLTLLVAVATIASVHIGNVQADTAPDIYVRNVNLSKNVYAAGDTINGSFQLINGNPTVGVPDVVYEVSLGGGYKNGIVSTIYDTKTFSPVFLQANERKDVTFSYTLPKAFSGTDMDIHVQAFLKSGTPLGWGDFPIKVTGGLPTLTVNTIALTVDGTKFNALVGPTIYKDKTGSLDLTVSNPSTSDLSLTPHIKIYKRSTTGDLVKEYDEAALNLKAKAKTDVSYSLPTFNYDPNVYLGELVFVDSNNVQRSLPFQFRYIIAGDIVTFTSITTDKPMVAKGDILPITVNYTGAPYDISSDTDVAAGDGTAIFDLKVYNEQDQLVGSYTDTTNFNASTSKVVSLTAAVAAKALRADVTATKDGKVLASSSVMLSPNYNQAKLDAVNAPTNNRMHQIAYAVAALILLIIVIVLIIKFMNRKKTVTMMVLFVFCFGFAYNGVEAFTITNRQSINGVWDYTSYDFNHGSYPTTLLSNGMKPQGYTNPNGDGSHWHIAHCTTSTQCDDLSPQITINSPGTIDTFSPGQTFSLVGSAYAEACLNNPQDIQVTASFNGGPTQTYTKYNANNFDGTHGQTTGSAPFSLGTFTAPSTPGTYTLNFRIDSFTNVPNHNPANGTTNLQDYQKKYGANSVLDPSTIGGYIIGTINVVVGGQAPDITFYADPNPIDYGQTTTLHWAVNNLALNSANSENTASALLASNVTSCVASDGWSGSVPTSGSQVTNPLYVTTQFTLTCTNAYGTSIKSTVVSVNPQGPCTSPPPSSQSPSPSDSGSVSPSSSPSQSGGTGYNYKQSQAANVILAQSDPCAPKTPQVSIFAAKSPVDYNTGTTLSWYSNDADSCTASGDWSGSVDTASNGNDYPTGNLTSAKTYIITCHNNASGNDGSAQVTVSVNPQVQDFTASCKATTPGHPSATSAVSGTQVTWTTTVVPTGTYTYAWSGDDGLSGSGSTASITYTTVGVKNAQVLISGGGTSHLITCNPNPFSVKPAPIFQEI